MRTAFFWVIMQRAVVISYLRFGTTYGYNLQVSRIVTFNGQEWTETAHTTRQSLSTTHKHLHLSFLEHPEMYVDTEPRYQFSHSCVKKSEVTVSTCIWIFVFL
jgi:hypothetical protein